MQQCLLFSIVSDTNLKDLSAGLRPIITHFTTPITNLNTLFFTGGNVDLLYMIG